MDIPTMLERVASGTTLCGVDNRLMHIQVCGIALTQGVAPVGHGQDKGAGIRGPIFLVHDRSTTHPSQPIPGCSWIVVSHPPHSCNLMPLYYGIFGTSKQELDRWASHVMPWADKVQLYKDILKAGPVEATIRAYESRLKACVAA